MNRVDMTQLVRKFARKPSKSLPGGDELTKRLDDWLDWLFAYYGPPMSNRRSAAARESVEVFEAVYGRVTIRGNDQYSNPPLSQVIAEESSAFRGARQIQTIVACLGNNYRLAIFMHANSHTPGEIASALNVSYQRAIETVSAARLAIFTALKVRPH